jgi:hypothetical protein
VIFPANQAAKLASPSSNVGDTASITGGRVKNSLFVSRPPSRLELEGPDTSNREWPAAPFQLFSLCPVPAKTGVFFAVFTVEVGLSCPHQAYRSVLGEKKNNKP